MAYEERLSVLQQMLENLLNAEPVQLDPRITVHLPRQAAVYLLSYEDLLPLYVGETGNICQRIHANLVQGSRGSHQLLKVLAAELGGDEGAARRMLLQRGRLRWLPSYPDKKRRREDEYFAIAVLQPPINR